jgi:hypothetical protein
MGDYDYWKPDYEDSWPVSAEKEEKIRVIIEKECKCDVEYAGLGAGTTKYLTGPARSRGFEKGGSDLHVKGTSVFIEVTGPNTERVGEEDDLWIRPDKIQHYINHPENDNWVVHVLKKNFHIRAIHITDDFKEDYKNGRFEIVHPFINFKRETYVAVPAESKYVKEIEPIFEAIKKACAGK